MAGSAGVQHQRWPADRSTAWPGAGRAVGAAFLAAGVAGLLVAVPARVLMRLVALAAGHQGQFSWSASTGIAVVFIVVMLPGALLAAATSGRWRWVLLAAAALLLTVPATGIAVDEVGGTSTISGPARIGLLAAGAGVYLCLALLPALTLRLVDRWSRR